MGTVPDRTEAAEYFFTYIDQVAGTDICRTLEEQHIATVAFLEGISEEQSLTRYAPGKWSRREVLSHVNDTERAFVFRAMCFARGLKDPLPGFDGDTGVAGAHADSRSWRSHVEEYRNVRRATLDLFLGLSPEAWMRRGVAGGNPFTVRALAFITAGHVAHHLKILRERY